MGRPKKNKSLQVKEKEVQMKEQLENSTTEKELDVVQTELDLARLELEKTKLELEERKAEMKKISSREHDAKELAIVEKQIAQQGEREGLKAKIEQQKARDNERVTGRFMNRRAPGQPAKLTYIKYADDPVKWYEFNDGGTYTIPRGFADQINEYYYTPHFTQKAGAMDPDHPDSQIADVDTSNKKYAFVAVGY